jgi:MFS family permease
MDATWRGRIGSSIIGAVVGALIGYALSLTQGAHPQRWPWELIGALFMVAVALLVWEQALAPRFIGDAPSWRSRKILNAFGKLLSEGERLQKAFEKHPTKQRPISRWERRAERTIRRRAGGDFSGLFMTADRITAVRPTPPSLANNDQAAKHWSALDRKIEWLRHQTKHGPHR